MKKSDIPFQQDLILEFHEAGSRYVCDPPVMDTDIDVCILVKDLQAVNSALDADGWEICTDYHNTRMVTEIEFTTARKGDWNLIVYENVIGYERFNAGTRIAKELNLLKKEDRVRAHIAATELAPNHIEDFCSVFDL